MHHLFRSHCRKWKQPPTNSNVPSVENYKLVMPEDLNHYGFLFGGRMLQWVDEYAYIGASLDFPGCNLVTVALDHVEFRRSVLQGTVLRFQVQQARVGTTSVQYNVNVFEARGVDSQPIFSTGVTYVRVDGDGAKIALPHPEDGR